MSDLSKLDADAVGEFFIDETGEVWSCIGWIKHPAAILHRYSDKERRTVVAQSMMGESYRHVELPEDFKVWLALHRHEKRTDVP